MASLTAMPGEPGATEATRPASAGRIPAFARHPVALTLMSAGLLWLSFPPVEWHGAAWVALVPLLLVVADPRPRPLRRWTYLATWLGGFVFWLLAIQWVLATDAAAWPGWLAMATALSLFWLVFAWASRRVLRRLGWPITVVAPVAWVGLEYARAHVLTGFPWYYLAHSQYRQVYWTQIADFAGSLGVSFLIVLVNAAIVEAVSPFYFGAVSPAGWRAISARSRIRLGLVALSALGTLGYGAFRVRTAEFRPGPRVAMLQSGEFQAIDPPRRKTRQELHEMYLLMVERAMKARARPDLVIWPETAYPFQYPTIDPLLDPKAFDVLVRERLPDTIPADWTLIRDRNAAEFRRILARHRVPMMVGTSTYDFRDSGFTRYNSAVLFQPGAEPQAYHKLHLVPFGEYIPYTDLLPGLIHITPFDGLDITFLSPGQVPTWFDLKPYRVAAAICFEDTLPHVVRRFFSEVPDGVQPDLLVNLTNDGWFGLTSEHEMHLAVSTFRCIENRVPMARAVNTGVSALIDGNGRILASMPKTAVGPLDAVAPLDDRTSLYSRWGDWLGQVTALGTVGFLALGWVAPRRPRPDPDRVAERAAA